MNNILSFTEFNGQELETMVYEQELNEGIMGKGIKGFFNKRASRRVKAELAEEIEMSKTIMEGIKSGLESLNSDFDILRNELDKEDDSKKGEKQKALDGIMKILEDSRKNTWDLNELIDEGEIDYTGFTANVGIASVAYFGILFTPFRAAVMIHKGYNYFFNIIKNTIRKSLVMLQLNFDQFENLIITKGFQSLDYLQDQDTSVKISEFYGKLQAKLFDEKTGMLKGKRGSEFAKQQMQLAKNQIDAMMKADKSRKLSDNAYNCLDQYNNTYTRSLETLRQYTQDDVQKQLDSIKTSMSKLAGQEVDLQTYSELIIAAAEEHAYKVSSDIYNKFAKMTEVFSLPNQKKLIDLIQAATKEQMDAAEKETAEKKEAADFEKKEEEAKEFEEKGIKIFETVEGSKSGKINTDTRKYDKNEINAEGWTYDKFKDLSNEDKDAFETWLAAHPEILEKCDESLQIYIDTPFNNSIYIDSLIDYIGLCLNGDSKKKNESVILTFDDYLFESSGDEDDEKEYELTEEEKKEIDSKLEDIENNLSELMKLIFGKDVEDINDLEITDESKARLDYVISKYKSTEEDEEDEEDDGVLYRRPTPVSKLMSIKKELGSKKKCYIDMSKENIDNSQFNNIKKLYGKKIAPLALVAIGKKVLKDNTFVKNSNNIVSIINKCVKSESRKQSISLMTYILLKDSIKELKDLRNHDYATVDKEKSEK